MIWWYSMQCLGMHNAHPGSSAHHTPLPCDAMRRWTNHCQRYLLLAVHVTSSPVVVSPCLVPNRSSGFCPPPPPPVTKTVMKFTELTPCTPKHCPPKEKEKQKYKPINTNGCTLSEVDDQVTCCTWKKWCFYMLLHRVIQRICLKVMSLLTDQWKWRNHLALPRGVGVAESCHLCPNKAREWEI